MPGRTFAEEAWMIDVFALIVTLLTIGLAARDATHLWRRH